MKLALFMYTPVLVWDCYTAIGAVRNLSSTSMPGLQSESLLQELSLIRDHDRGSSTHHFVLPNFTTETFLPRLRNCSHFKKKRIWESLGNTATPMPIICRSYRGHFKLSLHLLQIALFLHFLYSMLIALYSMVRYLY